LTIVKSADSGQLAASSALHGALIRLRG